MMRTLDVREGRKMGKSRKEKLRVMLVDDEAIVREWLKERINETRDMEVVAELRNGKQASEYLEQNREPIDLVVLDLAMPEQNGFETLQDVRKAQPRARTIIYTQHRDPEYVQKAQRRAQGYMLKTEPASQILPALRKVADGQSYFSPEITHAVDEDNSLETIARYRLQLSKLTQSEKEVVRCTAQGMTSRQTGELLGKSHRTVEEQLRKIYKKLAINNKAELAHFAVKAGLIK